MFLVHLRLGHAERGWSHGHRPHLRGVIRSHWHESSSADVKLDHQGPSLDRDTLNIFELIFTHFVYPVLGHLGILMYFLGCHWCWRQETIQKALRMVDESSLGFDPIRGLAEWVVSTDGPITMVWHSMVNYFISTYNHNIYIIYVLAVL